MNVDKNILPALDIDAVKLRTEELCALEQGGSFVNFPAVAEYCRRSLEDSGFENIEIIEHRADGKSSHFDCTIPPAWDVCGRSFLQIYGENTILADTAQIPFAAAPWSAPTPPEGVTGELVAVAPGEIADVKNKWVLLTIFDGSNPQGEFLQQLYRQGAVGVAVADFQSGQEYPDSIRWFNGTGQYGWYPVADENRLPLFAISGKIGNMLLNRLKNSKIILHGVMNTRIYSGSIYTVTAVVSGHSSAEYALFSHIYEPFAADNSFGFGAICAIGKAIRENCGIPEKTLRVVFSMELYGFAAFLADKTRASRIAGALNMDAVNHRKQKSLKFFESPLCNPWFGDLVIPGILTASLPDTAFTRVAGTLSDDTFPGDPLCGNIPVNWCMNPSGTAHHCGCPDFEPDWQWAKDELAALTKAIIKMLQFSPVDAGFLPEAVVKEFLEKSCQISEKNISGREKGVLTDKLYQFLHGQLLSAEKYCGTILDKTMLKEAYDAARSVIPATAESEKSHWEKQASQIIPLRLKSTPFSLAEIPLAERKSFRVSRLLYSLFDGKINLLDAIRINDWVCGKRSDDAAIQHEIGILSYLAKYNYVKLKQLQEG